MTERPCRACGMPLVFLPGPSGRVIPAQRVRTVYARRGELLLALDLKRESQQLALLEESEPQELYISHFETCPKAGQFSKRKPKERSHR